MILVSPEHSSDFKRKLSDAWYAYCGCADRGETFEDKPWRSTFEDCKIQNGHALKQVLGILCASRAAASFGEAAESSSQGRGSGQLLKSRKSHK
ncbi:unnamed protein product [Cuscuta campestris]|uniref:Uncharacterized protein n=1 Tax=Cuscuta campestris TaxID=132261 RepID=A0A484L1L6_9ASTE|nr:unnamed protein product [Cuscuta campestris]